MGRARHTRRDPRTSSPRTGRSVVTLMLAGLLGWPTTSLSGTSLRASLSVGRVPFSAARLCLPRPPQHSIDWLIDLETRSSFSFLSPPPRKCLHPHRPTPQTGPLGSDGATRNERAPQSHSSNKRNVVFFFSLSSNISTHCILHATPLHPRRCCTTRKTHLCRQPVMSEARGVGFHLVVRSRPPPFGSHRRNRLGAAGPSRKG